MNSIEGDRAKLSMVLPVTEKKSENQKYTQKSGAFHGSERVMGANTTAAMMAPDAHFALGKRGITWKLTWRVIPL